MVAVGIAKYDKLPGEWYGPGTACYVLRDLAEMHAKNDATMFRVHVAGSAGSVYKDEIETTMTRDAKARYEKSNEGETKNVSASASIPEHPLAAWEEIEPIRHPWDTSLLLLVPLRLGLKQFNEDYMEAVAHMFSLPQSVGVLGGRPRGARWFYGAVADGSQILGLDPHTVQTAPCRAGKVLITDEYIRSVHTTYTEVFSLTKMDPSIALGFYCRDRSDLETLLNSIKTWNEQNPNVPELFNVAETKPSYADSSAVHEVMMSSMLDDEDDVNSNSSEDDEYVML
jgi:cysteine protease ATG4